MPNAAYSTLCASISSHNSLDGTKSCRLRSEASAVAATVDETTALLEWTSTARRLIFDVVATPLRSMAEKSGVAGTVARGFAPSCQDA
ncbi:hypothetical protein MES4922_10053 [Mesorhizobium ventifaucium]|uniref:Uncharacterized protein n=1 Tax=Mesorhizobium ventifaucium TaxID=666020 RepID=A0ABM9DEJ8_9HYPH|nr:hypothetical protein MES4922_10053 [Mesorhizobium ventifaucium]